MDRHEEYEPHEEKNQAQLEKADAEVGEQFAEEQAEGTDRSDEKLLEGAAFDRGRAVLTRTGRLLADGVVRRLLA